MSEMIDRDATIKSICEKECDALKPCQAECESIWAVKEMPSVPRNGKWIEHDDGWANVYYECSVCKEPFVLIDGTPTENLYNFCPNCGCRMEEGDSK